MGSYSKMTDILVRSLKRQRHRRGEDHVTTEAEIAVMYLQAKKLHGLTAPARS